MTDVWYSTYHIVSFRDNFSDLARGAVRLARGAVFGVQDVKYSEFYFVFLKKSVSFSLTSALHFWLMGNSKSCLKIISVFTDLNLLDVKPHCLLLYGALIHSEALNYAAGH